MKDDKKKVVVLAVLAVAILAVGAFQFTAGSAPAPQPQAKKEKAANATNGAEAKAEANATGNESESGEVAANEAASTTYAPDRTVEATGALASLYSMKLPTRDPFSPGTLPAPAAEVKPAPVQQQPAPRSASNWRPTPQMPPFDPMGGSLPNVSGGISMQPNGQGAPVNLPPAEPTYAVSGVMRGPRNAAVLSDAQGNQRLVKEGQSLDGDTKVVSIENNKVTLRRKGKTITLSVGGNPQ